MRTAGLVVLLAVPLAAAAAPATTPESPRVSTAARPGAPPRPHADGETSTLIRDADLAPLLADGPGADGKAAYLAGHFDEAAAKLARSPLPEAAYLRALALLERSLAAEALGALEGLEAELPDLADRVLFLRAEALAAASRPKDALAAWAAIPEGSLLAPDARLARARLAQGIGDRAAALDALAPLLAAPPPPDLSRPDLSATALLLAGRLRASGAAPDRATARRDLLACWSDHPLAPESTDCLTALRALPGADGAPPEPAAVLHRAERLLDANRNAQALALLQPLLDAVKASDAASPFACKARAALGRAYRKERSFPQAIAALRPVVEQCADPDLRVRSLYLLASAASIAGDKDEAVSLYRRLAREFPHHAFADDALFYAADILARAGRTAEAREALSALVRDQAGGDYRDDARFKLAWLSKQAGQVDEAIAQLLVIEEEKDGRDPYEHARAAYWRARLLAGRGEGGRSAAFAIWTDLTVRYPTDYYGLLARARLVANGRTPPPPAAASLPATAEAAYDAGPLRADPHFRAGLLLLRLGLVHAAADELAASLPALRGAGDAADPVLLVADLLDRAGDHRTAHGLLRVRARTALRKPPSGDNVRVWRIAFPPAYRDDVKRWAPPANVPVDLVQALMREESALDPRVISPAGAIGLTQLMLPTAQSVARELRIGRPSRNDLMQASLNIRLGARYLGSLIRQFDGSVALAVAAYNAGGGAVSHWLQTRGGLDVDEFVEEIPIEETRGYVKRVLRSYATYRLLYGSPEEASAPGLFRHGGGKT
ncbi:lytic transglycosylase domain-containing protein [Anaeromyxobacter oryzae]|uniref:Murein transglycosylase n=1 Tax=Anaeromyxobacter oryzae TaxID=2918170 RepID=A0ABN6N0L5_9BACT|nr:transglycosylase SLT domain-containing protein [Anaeromyxobacter oryzae]BDG06731.1 murein transglycosylase [Anaeromyxobacter oryzae]